MQLVAVTLVAAAAAVLLAGRAWPGAGRSPLARARRTVGGDLGDILRVRGAVPAIGLASAVVVLGHAATFLIAARAAGSTAPASRLLPLAFLAMSAMVLPSIAGWGPREGAAAWVFSAAGLGAAAGAATAVAYGVLVFVAFLPGAVVLVAGWLPRRRVALEPKRAADA
jgi:hypothetical protein